MPEEVYGYCLFIVFKFQLSFFLLFYSQSIYLACVVGCLDVVTNDDEPAFGSEARLGELLRLLVKTDPDLVAAASTWGDTGADGLSKGFQREDGSAREESSARCSKRPRATRDGTGFRGRDAHFESDDGIPCCPGVERAALIRALAYAHFRHQGLVVKDGVLLGCHFLLYRGSPADVHSDYGVWVQGAEVGLHSRSQLGCGVEGFPEDRESSSDESWLHVNRLSRLLQDVSKRLVVCAVETGPPTRVVELSFN